MSEPVRLAMVGAGWWANTAHLPAMTQDPRIRPVAVVDPDPVRARAVAERWGIDRWHDSVDELVAAGGVEGAVVATPHTTHRTVAERLLEGGLDVLVEKPLTTTARDATALVETAERLGRVLSVGLTYQYAPSAARVRAAVQEELGDLVCVNAEFSSGTASLFAATESPEDPAAAHGTTYSDPALSGGGQGQTQLTHLLGSLLWSTGAHPADVFAYMSRRGLPVDLVDALAFRLEGGALGAATSTGTTPGGAEVRHRIRFHGTRAMIEHDLLAAEAWVFHEDGAIEHIRNPEDRPSYDHGAPVRTFARVIRGEAENPAPGAVAARSVAMVEAAYRSAASGAPVSIAELLAEA